MAFESTLKNAIVPALIIALAFLIIQYAVFMDNGFPDYVLFTRGLSQQQQTSLKNIYINEHQEQIKRQRFKINFTRALVSFFISALILFSVKEYFGEHGSYKDTKEMYTGPSPF